MKGRRLSLRHAMFAAVLVLNLALAVACGGGGGGGDTGAGIPTPTPSASPSVSPSPSPTPTPSATPTPTPTPTPLAVESVSPADGETGVPLFVQVKLKFNQPLNTADAETRFTLTGPGGEVNGGITWEDGDATLVFTPYALLQAEENYTVRMTAGTVNAAGDAMLTEDFVSTFTTGTGSAEGAPTVTACDPNALSGSVPVDTAVEITFSEEMDETSAEEAFSLVKTGETAPVNGTFSWDAESKVMTFRPDSPLAYGSWYTVVVSNEAASAAGVRMAAPYMNTFFTQQDPSAPPTVQFVYPIDGLTGVPVTTSVSVRFSTEMDHTATEAAFSLSPTGGGRVSGTFLWSGSTMLFKPDDPLITETQFTITIGTGAKSAAGVALEEEYTSTFTTGKLEDSHFPLPTLGTETVSVLDGAPDATLWEITASAATLIDGRDYNVTDSRWAPSGGRIAYRKYTQKSEAGVRSGYELYLWSGGTPEKLSSDGAEAGLYAWNTTGDRLAFFEKLSGTWYLTAALMAGGADDVDSGTSEPYDLFWRDATHLVYRMGSTLKEWDAATKTVTTLAADASGKLRISPSRGKVLYVSSGTARLTVFDLENGTATGLNAVPMFDYYAFAGDEAVGYAAVESFIPFALKVVLASCDGSSSRTLAGGLSAVDCRITEGCGSPDGSYFVFFTLSASLNETYRAHIVRTSDGTETALVALDAAGGTRPFWLEDQVAVSSPLTRSFLINLSDGSTAKTMFFDTTTMDYKTDSLGVELLICGPVLYRKLFGNWQEIGLFGLSAVKAEFKEGSVAGRPR